MQQAEERNSLDGLNGKAYHSGAIRANAVASAFATSQAPNELCYRSVGAKAESPQPLLRNRGAMAATQTLKSDTLHTQLRRFVPVDDNGDPRMLLSFEPAADAVTIDASAASVGSRNWHKQISCTCVYYF